MVAVLKIFLIFCQMSRPDPEVFGDGEDVGFARYGAFVNDYGCAVNLLDVLVGKD